MSDALTICTAPPGAPLARAILRAYLADVVGRFHGRQLTPEELDGAVQECDDEDLVAPRGLLIVAMDGERALGCAGLRVCGGAVGELTRVYVDPLARRRGVAQALIAELELRARRLGLERLRLDTRADLHEARALYAALGFDEVDAFNAEPYAEYWFERRLR